MNAYHSLAKIVLTVAGIISLIVLIAIPVGYFLVAYRYESAALQVEADRSANSILEIIDANPVSWRSDKRRLVVALILNTPVTAMHRNHIRDEHGNSIAFIPVELDWPVVTRSAVLSGGNRVAGEKVIGEVEVAKSMRQLLLDTGIAALLSAMLALAIYFALKILPLRALTRVVQSLDEAQELLRGEIQAKEQALLEARNIGSAMRHQAMHDGLTNLPNRILLHDRLQQAILISLREKKMLALIMMDLDQFKAINDPRNRSCHSTHASIHLATQGTQHERRGLQLGGWPFALSSLHSGRIEACPE